MRTTLKVRKLCGLANRYRCPRHNEDCDHSWVYEPMIRGTRKPAVEIDQFVRARGGPRHVRTERQAEQWAAAIQHEWLLGRDPRQTPAEQTQAVRAPQAPTVAQLVAAYRTAYALETDRSKLKQPQVVLSELRHIEGFCGTWTAKTLERHDDVRRFETALVEGWSPVEGTVVERGESGVKHLLVRLRAVVRFGLYQHPAWLDRSPFGKHGLHITDEEGGGRIRRLHDGEEEALLEACRAIDNADHKFAGRYLRRRILGVLETAGRGSELNRVRAIKEHLVLSKFGCKVTFIGREAGGGKSMKSREVPFDPSGPLATELGKCRFLKAPHDSVFGDEAGNVVSQYKAWVTALLLAHGKIRADGVGRTAEKDQEAVAAIDLQFRDLRRECASRWRDRGMDVREIQILLGHSTLKMTQRYLQLPEGDYLATKLGKVMGWA
jgi:integrase